MNINKKTIILLIPTLLFSSCKKNNNDSSSSVTYKEVELSSLNKASTTYKDENNVEKNLNMNTLYTNYEIPRVDSLLSQKCLVVPFSFVKDETDTNDTVDADDTLLEKIKVTFTGTSEEITKRGGDISVDEFYKTSSYGKENLEFDVLNTYIEYSNTAKQFEIDASYSTGGIYASEYISTYYTSEYQKEGHGKLGEDAKPLSYYDEDDDGFIDLLWIIYTYPYQKTSTSNFWWAYVTSTGNEKGTTENPTVQTLGWASSEFLNSDSSLNGYDSHTFIHETGHTFGLSDYYDYKHTFSPIGGIDYMDQNIGDHCAYSKFSLGWITPYVVKEEDLKDGEIVITLNAFTTSGEALLLASPNYNNTAFDEYFLVELVAPVSIAKKDYISGYNGTYGYLKPGIRITHIDSRVYNTNHDTYLQDKDDIGRNGKSLRLSNSYMGRIGIHYDSDYYEVTKENKTIENSYSLISLIESNVKDKNSMNTYSYVASSDSLFKAGDSFYLQKSDEASIWATTYMPSMSNLYNKSKTITGWTKDHKQTYTIDNSMKCSYSLDVLSIEENDTYGYTSKIKLGLSN